MSRASAPRVDDAAALPTIACGHVSEDVTDNNGHLNVRGYYDHAVAAADSMLHNVGIDDHYRNNLRLGAFGVEHHITFLSEMQLGDMFSIHGLWLERSARAAHMVVFIVDNSKATVSCMVELVVVNVDLDSRRATAFSDAVGTSIATAVTATEELRWPLDLDTAMSLAHSREPR